MFVCSSGSGMANGNVIPKGNKGLVIANLNTNKIQKNSNSEQHFDCFIESMFRLGCSHHQD